MSAAGRGKRKRVAKDYYPTPGYCVRRLLEEVELPGGAWLEPCVGDGAIVRAVNETRSDIVWYSCEIRDVVPPIKQSHFHHHVDFLKWPTPRHWDVIITNPSYAIAQETVEKALGLTPVVAMLLRIGFLESARRNEWVRKHTPSIYILPNRPSFKWKGSDATTYSWMVWSRARPTVKVLKATSLAERIADRDMAMLVDLFWKSVNVGRYFGTARGTCWRWKGPIFQGRPTLYKGSHGDPVTLARVLTEKDWEYQCTTRTCVNPTHQAPRGEA